MIVTKCYLNGDTIWREFYGGGFSEINDIRRTHDRGFILATVHDGVIKLDSAGNIQWQKTLLYDNISATELIDSNYIVAGTFAYLNYQVAKLDSAGDTLWTRDYGYYNSPVDGILASSILQLPSSDLLILCMRWGVNSGGNTSWNMMRLDYATGDTLAIYNFAHALYTGQLEDLAFTNDGNIISNMAGTLTKLDTAGNLLWYVDIPYFYLYQVIPTYDGGYFGVGEYRVGSSSNTEIAYVKTDSMGNVTTFVPDIFAAASDAYIYPNPFTTSANLTFKNPQHQKVTLTVYGVLGNAVLSKETNGDNFLIERGGMKSGVYFYEVRENEKMLRGKFVVE